MSTKSKIFTNEIEGLPVSFIDLEKNNNNICFVNSSNSNASDADGYGGSPSIPFATIDYAIGTLEDTNGDTIYVMPGHTESGLSITGDKSNIKIIGLGNGSDRPTLTFSATGNTITFSSNNISIENILFLSGIDSITKKITLSGDNCKIHNCEFKDVTDVEAILDIVITGDNCQVTNCFKNGYLSGDANTAFISANGAVNPIIKNNVILTKCLTAIVNFVTGAVTNCILDNNITLVSGTTDLSKNVVDTITGSTYTVKDCFDSGAGSSYSGNDVSGLAGDDVGAIATYHNVPSADSADNVRMRDVIGNKTDTIAGNSAYSKLIQMANNLNYKNPRFLNVTADMSSATWNTVATHEVFTVLGLVKMSILAVCKTTIADGASGGTLEFGDEDDTDRYIATTTGTDLDQYDIWHDATPDSKSELVSDCIKDIVVYDADIGYEIKTGALTSGEIDFYCIWEPINSGGSVSAGDGSALV